MKYVVDKKEMLSISFCLYFACFMMFHVAFYPHAHTQRQKPANKQSIKVFRFVGLCKIIIYDDIYFSLFMTANIIIYRQSAKRKIRIRKNRKQEKIKEKKGK